MRYRSGQIWVGVLLSVLLASGCRPPNKTASAEDSSATQKINTDLTFNNLTLEEADDQGRIQWKVKAAEVVSSPDKKTAKVKFPTGQLYQNGQPIYRVQAKTGQIFSGGDKILLRGEVVTTDVQSGAVLRADQLEWRPKQDLLIMRGNLRGAHPQVQLTANQIKLFNKQRRAELSGKVNALTQDPKLQIQTEQITWLLKDQKLVGTSPLQALRMQNNKPTDRATANAVDVDLVKRTAHLKQNAQLAVVDPPLQISGNSLVWDIPKQTLVSDQPLLVLDQQQQIRITANRGRMELQPKVAYFNGNVNAISARNQSKLNSDDLTWQMKSQEVTAVGNVVYVQPDPPATLRGGKAIGKLQNRTVVMSGGRVVTEIVPRQSDLPPG
jgi:LPS export ABC transporter protein LptC